LDMQAIIWETQDYQPQAIFPRHTAAINALSCQSNSTTVASASQGGAIRVWSVDSLQELHGFYQDTQLPINAIAFAPAGDQLAVGGNDGYLRLWENGLSCQQSSVTARETLCVDAPQRLRAHTAPIRSIAWSPDGHYLATGGEDNILAIWSVSSSGQMPTLLTAAKHTQPILALSWSPTHQRIAAASGNAITIWTLHI
jgi:WD40 repeat protein